MKTFLKVIQSILFSIWLFIGFVGVVLVYGSYVLIKVKIIEKRKDKKSADDYIRNVVSWFGRVTFKFLFSKVKVIGKENIPKEGPYVIVSNHQSIFDIPLILGYVYPSGFIAKEELSKIPILGKFIKSLGSILIDRKNPKSGAIALKRFAQAIQQESILTIFPEGTRSLDGKVNEFKRGSLLIPFRYNVKILPVSISGTINMNKKGSFLIKSSNVELKIHQPIEPKSFENEESLRNYVRDIISKEVENNEKN